MLRAIATLPDVIFKVALKLKIAVTFIAWHTLRAYKPVANISIKLGIRRIYAIRVIGICFVSLYAVIGCVEAGNRYSRKVSDLGQSAIAKTVTGLSEIQCIIRCRRSADCDTSFFEKKSHGVSKSHCHFLKDNVDPNRGDVNMKNGIMHEKVKEIGE